MLIESAPRGNTEISPEVGSNILSEEQILKELQAMMYLEEDANAFLYKAAKLGRELEKKYPDEDTTMGGIAANFTAIFRAYQSANVANGNSFVQIIQALKAGTLDEYLVPFFTKMSNRYEEKRKEKIEAHKNMGFDKPVIVEVPKRFLPRIRRK